MIKTLGYLRWKAADSKGRVGLAIVAILMSPVLAAGQVEVTFTKDIAPILQRSCQGCHHPEAATPMSLISYEEVRPWAKAIKLRTSRREMPPWYIEKTVGIQRFKDDPSLSDEEIAKIAAWADSGAPRGNPADMPPPRQFATGEQWSIGKPDLIVSSPVMTIKTTGPDSHIDLGTVLTGLTEDRYIKAVEFKEIKLQRSGGEYRKPTIHHVVLTGGDPDEFDGENSQVPPSSEPDQPESNRFRIVHEVGQNATIYPDRVGVLLKAGSALWFYSMHTHSNGQEEVVRVDVGFTFQPKSYKPEYPQSGFINIGNNSDDIDIPAGADNVRFDTFGRLDKNAIMTTFEPHMHMSGKRMCVEAIYPDGKREMLNCAGYNHNWVKVYMYEDDAAPLLPAGTILHIIGWYNNSETNRNNIEPRNWKGWGERTFDDMFAFLPKMTWLTNEQFKAEATARVRRQRKSTTTTAAR
jgi:hypothetical protein